MAYFEIPCECGASLRVSAGQAGTNTVCVCGRNVGIPRLRELQKFRVWEKSDVQASNGRGLAISFIAVVALLFVVWFWNLPMIAIFLYSVMFFGGKLWFLAIMFREMGAPALLVFIIPFFDWLFLFKRFDVAWKPVFMQFIGLLFLATGVTELM